MNKCFKPGYSLTFGFKCMKDDKLREIGLSQRKVRKYIF